MTGDIYPSEKYAWEIEKLRAQMQIQQQANAEAQNMVHAAAGRITCDPVENGWLITFKGKQYIAKGDAELADEIIRILTNDALAPKPQQLEAKVQAPSVHTMINRPNQLWSTKVMDEVKNTSIFDKLLGKGK